MKTISEFFLLFVVMFFLIFLLTGCQNRSTMNMKQLPDGQMEVIFNANKKYLLVPIQDNSGEKDVSFIVDDNRYTYTYKIRLAEEIVNYYMPVDLQQWPKCTQIKLHVKDAMQKGIWRDSMRLSDIFDYQYAEKYRPLYHFSPAYGWMNDPNGLVYHDGLYHLFYQHNPYGTVWGNMHWGHAVSDDLFHWQYKPIALAPDSLGTIYSGCAVIDTANTAGFGKNAMILIFTSANEKMQTQCIAYSTDNGNTFTKYDKNPVLVNPQKKDFRDPKVFWHPCTHQWIMVVAAGNEMQFYSSANLKQWIYESSFGAQDGNHDGVWECPDLFKLAIDKDSTQMKWVLLCNINPGGIQGGSATQYFIGSFDGHAFRNCNSSQSVKWMDWGKDHYATVTWSNTPGRRIAIGWMNNWEYAQQTPTIVYRSSKTVPRELTLSKYGDELTLFSYPVRELQHISGTSNDMNSFDIKSETNVAPLLADNKGAYDINFMLMPGNSKTTTMRIANNQNEYVSYQFNFEDEMLLFDRHASGIVDFNPNFVTVEKIPLPRKSIYEIRLLVDKSSLELFIDGGAINVTNLVYPTQIYDILSFSSILQDSARIVELNVTPISQTMKSSTPFMNISQTTDKCKK